jgi:hypothetical protein
LPGARSPPQATARRNAYVRQAESMRVIWFAWGARQQTR